MGNNQSSPGGESTSHSSSQPHHATYSHTSGTHHNHNSTSSTTTTSTTGRRPHRPSISQKTPNHSYSHSTSSSHNLPRGTNPPSVAQPHYSFESAQAQHTSQSRASATDVLRSASQAASHQNSPIQAIPIRKTSIDPTTEISSQQPSRQTTPIMGQGESRIKHPAKSSGSTPSTPAVARPIDVSSAPNKKLESVQTTQQDHGGSFGVPFMDFRNPRLPLPIGGLVHEPGSPIISPQDLQDPIEFMGDLPRQSSLLSSTTLDDDSDSSDRGDDLATVRGGVLPPVPTTVEWKEGGDRVFVTGTFADWNNKYRLYPRKDGSFALTLKLQPGTYHLRFIVDTEMVLSKELPTAVDFTNCLVNYLEVVPETNPETPGGEPYIPPHLKSETLPIPVQRPHGSKSPQDLSLPQQVPPTPELGPVAGPSSVPPQSSVPARADLPIQIIPDRLYTRATPQFFMDVEADADTPEDSQQEDYWRTAELAQHLPSPPSLPGFLTKSIHNMHTPVKDDASVLANPNHTVLNHLTTSSIKGGVIATSMTTRYGRKFLTTILYKPTQSND